MQSASMPDLVTLGETMVLLNPVDAGALRYATQFQRQFAGAESNTAIGAARLGVSAGWISRIGDDPFGEAMVMAIRGEGVDVSQVRVDDDAPTGLFFKQRSGLGETSVRYYRKGSAASRLCADDIDADYLGGAKMLHISGITAAISDTARAAAMRAMEIARDRGLRVSVDPNLRLTLWSADVARPVLRDMMAMADIVLIGRAEGKALFDTDDPQALADGAMSLGTKLVAVKLDSDGAAVTDGGALQHAPAVTPPRIVDHAGAGDAFAAGFLTGLLRDWSPLDAARLGNVMGACALTGAGDIETLPNWADAVRLLEGSSDLAR